MAGKEHIVKWVSMRAGRRGQRGGQEDGQERGFRCMRGNAIVKHVALYANLKEDKEIHWAASCQRE